MNKNIMIWHRYDSLIRVVFEQCLDTGIWKKVAKFTIERLHYYDYDDPVKGFFCDYFKLKEIEQPTVEEACRQSRILLKNYSSLVRIM